MKTSTKLAVFFTGLACIAFLLYYFLSAYNWGYFALAFAALSQVWAMLVIVWTKDSAVQECF